MKLSAEHYRLLMESLPDALYILDTAGRIAFANAKLEQLTGYSVKELLGQRCTMLVAPRAVPMALDRRQRALPRAPEPSLLETELIHKDGTRLPVELATTSLIVGRRWIGWLVVARDVSQRKQTQIALREREERIRQLVYSDPLTGLPNRTLFQEHLQRAILAAQPTRTPLALLLLGLDCFQEINTTLGYPHGDLLLQQVGQRLRHVVLPDGAMLARVDADTFALLIPAGAQEAKRMAQLLLDTLRLPFAIEPLSLEATASIGIALFPEQGAEATALMRLANVALWAARQAGVGYAIYAAAQDHYSPQRLAFIAEIRRAMEQGQLCLHYQPLVQLQTGQVSGMEALIRWRHPQHGLIPPAEFIPAAEQGELIRSITLWALKAALRQCQAWLEAGHDLTVAVNLSVRNLYDARLADQIAELLDAVGVAASRLMLEITESFIMADPARARDILKRLWTMGIRLAIDDFGTGYSSLGYLKRLPVQAIKIDKTFVRGLMRDRHDAAIVRATIDLGHHLGLTVVAEGVEDQQTWHGLVALGCDEAQGYYISPPLAADDLSRWLGEARDMRPLQLNAPSWSLGAVAACR
jgi:diguanylate cyclase (GGDEF)-like protein/PAS domain S-box-containing protein